MLVRSVELCRVNHEILGPGAGYRVIWTDGPKSWSLDVWVGSHEVAVRIAFATSKKKMAAGAALVLLDGKWVPNAAAGKI